MREAECAATALAEPEDTLSSEEEFFRVPTGFTARRDRVLRVLIRTCREDGVATVCAPAGFGKTALLLQYAALVNDDMTRGEARVLDASGMTVTESFKIAERALQDLDGTMRPVVAIDNMPIVPAASYGRLSELIAAYRDEGCELVLSCLPTNRLLVKAVGEKSCIFASSLIVQPREYAQWARLYSISPSLDVYELTQGVPALVAMLQSVASKEPSSKALSKSIVGLYRAALNDLQAARDPLFRICALMMSMGSGSIDDLERCGVRVKSETLGRLSRDWPLFNYAPHTREFSCLGARSEGTWALRRAIAQFAPHIVSHAGRMLIKAKRFDDAMLLCDRVLAQGDAVALIAMCPTGFVLHGHGRFVTRLLERADGPEGDPLEAGALLAVHLAALTMGDYRLARSAAGELRRRADEIEQGVDAREWGIARALNALWASCSGMGLPKLSDEYLKSSGSRAAARLISFKERYGKLLAGDGHVEILGKRHAETDADLYDEIDLVEVAEWMLRALNEALHGKGCSEEEDMRFEHIDEALMARRLTSVAARVHMVRGVQHLMQGEPIGDERAFIDASTVAVRESDLATQLFCMTAEGWQELVLGQVVNAQFRGQQVLKLAPEGASFLQAWGYMLERCATLQNASSVSIRDQADTFDLSERAQDAAHAWSVALLLSAARFDSELSAWYSLHKDLLLESAFVPIARLAIDALGEKAEAVYRLIPKSQSRRYRHEKEQEEHPVRIEIFNECGDVGQVCINLFGGFHVLRNGHVLTDEVWRRKRASSLAARLALSMGAFIDRKSISDEMWPDMDYAKARKNLYVTASSLRSALSQQKTGPQYVLTQADGLALNSEYVSSDVRTFDLLAREVLLKKTGLSAQDIIEDCLKIERLYVGPLFVPNVGNPQFFAQMRRTYLSKFIDCMIRGIDAALENESIASATWLTEATLRQAPTREDVIRRAMAVFDACGRRREVVELYNSHLHYLESELRDGPEDETRIAYERIIRRAQHVEMI